MPDQRGRLLVAALGFAVLPQASYDRALWALRTWLDSWPGIGRIAVGMAHQGFDLQLTRYDERGWRATFYTSGIGALVDERDRHRVGADAVARDAAGGVGGAQGEPSVSSRFTALDKSAAARDPGPVRPVATGLNVDRAATLCSA
jgi:hypothetical protein